MNEELKELLEELEVLEYIDQDEVYDNFDQLWDAIEDNGGFNVDIIYYASAMKYLIENDTSLRRSLEVAQDYGYELKNLNSETLASLLASQDRRDEVWEHKAEIEQLLIEDEDDN